MAGRPFEFPNPNYVTPAEPCTMMMPMQILGLYNQAHSDEAPMQRVVEKVQRWVDREAKNTYHWDTVTFADSCCILGRTDLEIK